MHTIDFTIKQMGKLIYTTAIYICLTHDSWEKIFCYDDPHIALDEYMKLKTGNDETERWIARRPI